MLFDTSPNRELVMSVTAGCPTATLVSVNQLFLEVEWPPLTSLTLEACIQYVKANKYASLQVTHTGHKLEVSRDGAFVAYESPWFGVNDEVFNGRVVVSKNRKAPNFLNKGSFAIVRMLTSIGTSEELEVIFHESVRDQAVAA